MNNIDKESLRMAEFRAKKMNPYHKENRDALLNEMTKRGYLIERVGAAWSIISNEAVNPDVFVQLEIEPSGSNFDMVLIESPSVVTPTFPLGGGWGVIAWTKMDEENISFTTDRLESFFGIVHVDPDNLDINPSMNHNAANWDKVQRALKDRCHGTGEES